MPCFSQVSGNVVDVRGYVMNYLTREGIDSSRVELLSVDSTYICDAKMFFQKSQSRVNQGRLEAMYQLEISAPGDYILRCTHPNYRTEYVALPFHPKKDQRDFDGPDIEMRRKPKTISLQEVTVTASKVKFYYHGDTLVYNADAFNLADGSMLDALIRQLPGAELKSDGRIYVRGRFVESLLLNGKEFFRGDNRVMLDNLPAYMVKNVKVFERTDEYNKHADPIYTMDVRLKKEYEVSWLANATGGYAPSLGNDWRDSWLARLFALRFTRQSRVAVFGSVNNVNDRNKPSLDGDWTPDKVERGLLTNRQVGVDYDVSDKNSRWKINGNTLGTWNNSNNRRLSSTQNYLPGGDTYGTSLSQSWGRSLSVRSDNDVWLFPKTGGGFLQLQPKFEFTHNRTHALGVSGTFNADPAILADGMTLIDSIRSMQTASRLGQTAINRNIDNSLTKSDHLSVGTEYRTLFYLDKNQNYSLWLQGGIHYSHDKSRAYSLHQLDYWQEPVAADHRNRYDYSPSTHFDVNARMSFPVPRVLNINEKYTKFNISPTYEYGYSYDKATTDRYRLDKLPGWADLREEVLGDLPPDSLLDEAFDYTNSYDEATHEHRHNWTVDFDFKRMNFGRKKNLGLRVLLQLPLLLTDEHTDYRRAALDTTMTRHKLLFNPHLSVSFDFARKDDTPWNVGGMAPSFTFDYRMTQRLPRQTQLVDINDDTDPLFITSGNPHLQRTITHNFSLSFSSRPQNPQMYNASMGLRITDRAIVYGYSYDCATGVRHLRPDNVSGNWSGSASFGMTLPLDKARKWTLRSNTYGSFYHNVSLVSTSLQVNIGRRRVETLNLDEQLKVDWRINDKTSVGLKGRGTWIHADSQTDGFQRVNAADFHAGFYTVLQLPWQLGLSTDITCYSRRGYNDPGMNGDEVVWNARLTRSFFKGQLLLALEGVDIFGQLSNIQRAVNAEGRTETTYNVIPRYIMLTASVRLSKKAKEKQL